MTRMATEIIKHVITFCGVEILARVKSNDEDEIAKLETVSAIIQIAFIPKSVKENLEKEKVLK